MKKRLLFYLIFILALALFAELIARAYYYRKPALSRSAAYQLLKDVEASIFPGKKKSDARSMYFVRPNLAKEVNDSIAMQTDAANRLIYQPWISFTSINSEGKYVSVSNEVRKSDPSVSVGSGSDTTVIWFLGGSTTFGIGVTDAETIPSAFIRLWQQKNNHPIKVVNYATPLYYSYQELMLFADNLFRGKLPQVLIMLDGLNDCAAPYASYLRNPYSAPRLQQLLNPELYKYPKGFSYAQWPDSPDQQKVSQMIVDHYLENIANVKQLADEYKVQLYCFWQPVPYYGYHNRSTDPFCAKNNMPQYDFIYPRIEDSAKKIEYLFDIAGAVNEVRYPFLDSVHYTPIMSEAIAKRMLDSIAIKIDSIPIKK